jgi:hypothetical protein
MNSRILGRQEVRIKGFEDFGSLIDPSSSNPSIHQILKSLDPQILKSSTPRIH